MQENDDVKLAKRLLLTFNATYGHLTCLWSNVSEPIRNGWLAVAREARAALLAPPEAFSEEHVKAIQHCLLEEVRRLQSNVEILQQAHEKMTKLLGKRQA